MRRSKLWGLIFLGTVLLLGTAETALRVRYRSRFLRDRNPTPGAITLVALGDSIVAGFPTGPQVAWPAVLGRLLAENQPAARWRIVNVGVPGDTAPLGYARFDDAVAAAGPQVVLLAFGLNDCSLARHGLDAWYEARVPAGIGGSYLWQTARARATRLGREMGWLEPPQPELTAQAQPRTTADGFAHTVSALIERTWAVDAQPVLLTMTPLAGDAVDEVKAFFPEYRSYNARLRQIATHEGIPLVELAAGAPDGAFEADGVHLTATGQAWVAGQVYSQLAAAGFWSRVAKEAVR